MQQRNARIGFVLFAIYLAIYGGFVFLSAFWPSVMEWTPLAGVNLAIWYGVALILVAFGMALFYGWVCQDGEGDSQ